jgi:hypothetical protein
VQAGGTYHNAALGNVLNVGGGDELVVDHEADHCRNGKHGSGLHETPAVNNRCE